MICTCLDFVFCTSDCSISVGGFFLCIGLIQFQFPSIPVYCSCCTICKFKGISTLIPLVPIDGQFVSCTVYRHFQCGIPQIRNGYIIGIYILEDNLTASAPVFNGIISISLSKDICIITISSVEPVISFAAIKNIITIIAVQRIISCSAIERIISAVSRQIIISSFTIQRIPIRIGYTHPVIVI